MKILKKKMGIRSALLSSIITCFSAHPSVASVSFSEIEVRGLERVSEEKIRSACEMTTARQYDSVSLERLVTCLGNTGNFETVELETEGDKLLVLVKEKKHYRGLLDISMSVDSERGLSAAMILEQEQLWGTELFGGLQLDASKYDASASATIARQGLFSNNSVSALLLQYEAQKYPNQNHRSSDLSLSALTNWSLENSQELQLKFGVKQERISDFDTSAGPILRRDEGKRDSVFVGLSYSKSGNLAGLTSTAKFRYSAASEFLFASGGGIASVRVNGEIQKPIFEERATIGVAFSAGSVGGFGSGLTRASDRFHLGGDTLRGFSYRGVGPMENGSALGGVNFANLQFDSDFALGQLAGVGFNAGAFLDMGSSWGLDGNNSNIDTSAKIRAAVGLSLTIEAKGIPVSVYYAQPVAKETGDKVEKFGFYVGHSF